MQYSGTSMKQVPVHKKDAEGVLLIDALTGHVVTDQHDRPEWAEGLVLAQLAERHIWYTNRLGPAYTPDMASPDRLAYEDLGWCKMAPDEETHELVEAYHDADAEFRMEVLATVLGVDLSALSEDEAFAGLSRHMIGVEIARDDKRTDGELAELRAAQAAPFAVIEGGQGEERKTGTAG